MVNQPNTDYSPSLQDNEEALCQAYSPNYKEVFSFHNISDSAKKCTKNVLWKASVQMFTINRLQWCANLYKQLEEHTYKSKGFCKFYIHERGKTRFIQSVHISERAVQKTLNNYGLKPVIERKLIYDNGASREGKGTQFAINELRQHLATHYRKYRKQGGILLIDIHDYFNSIPHEKLKAMLRKAIKDDDLYNQAVYFIDCFDGDVGIGLGSEICQVCAIYYPNAIDHYIKERLHIKGYGRYMDDIYLIHYDIEYLKKCRDKIIKMLSELDLTVNPKTHITRFNKGNFVYLKRRFSIFDTGKIITRLLRKNTTKRRQLLKKHRKLLDSGKADIGSIHQSYQAWRGYALKWDSRQTVRNMDKLYYELFGKEDKDVGKFYRPRNRKGIERVQTNDSRRNESIK